MKFNINLTKYALKAEYQDFLTSYDPYTCFEFPEVLDIDDPAEMLYNLVEIRKNNFQDVTEDDTEETRQTLKDLDKLIERFNEVGVVAQI